MPSSEVSGACASCGEPLPSSARFCPGCGAAQAPSTQPPRETRRTVTLLFCDLIGSTALGEAMDPEALRALLGRYFAVAKGAVERHGGTVEKFVGDAVLAVFGVPKVHEDDAMRAVRAAAELQQELAVLWDAVHEGLGVRLDVRVGVNTGPVVVGDARGGGSFATGDAVNTAARLEQAAEPGQVLLGASTWALVRDAVVGERVPDVQAKGKSERLPAYRLQSVDGPAARQPSRRQAPLLGRDPELAALHAAYDRVRDGAEAHTLTLLGAAGIGKTRLVEEFLDQLSADCRVLRTACPSYGSGTAYRVLAQALRDLLDLHGQQPPDLLRRALASALEGALEAEAVLERLLPLLTGAPSVHDVEQVAWAVQALLTHLSRDRVLVLVVDDLQWADPTLLELLEQLNLQSRRRPLLLVCPARPEFADSHRGWSDALPSSTTITLAPLRAERVAQQLAAVLQAPVHPAAAEMIATWCDGNPLLVEELAAHLRDTDVLQRESGTWVLTAGTRAVAQAGLPATVEALLTARLDRLPHEHRLLLERLSVVGGDIGGREVTVLALNERQAVPLLDELVRVGLLRRLPPTRGTGWSFRHELLREAAYRSMAKALRVHLHEKLADALHDGGAVGLGGQAGLAAEHLERAAHLRHELAPRSPDTRVAAEHAAAALSVVADAARDAGALGVVAESLTRATGLRDLPLETLRSLLWRLAVVHSQVLQIDEASRSLNGWATMALPTRVEEQAATALRLQLRADAGEEVAPEALLTAADEAVAAARAAGDLDRLVIALDAQVNAKSLAGDYEGAERLLQELLPLVPPAGRNRTRIELAACGILGTRDVREVLDLLADLRVHVGPAQRDGLLLDSLEAAALATAGATEAARVRVSRVLAEFAELDPFAVTGCAFMLHEAFVSMGDLPAAVEVLGSATTSAERSGSLSRASTLLGFHAMALIELGRPAEAATQARRARDVSSPHDPSSMSLVHCAEAVLASGQGDTDLAAAGARQALAIINSTTCALRADIHRWLGTHAMTLPVPRRLRLLQDAGELYRARGAVVLQELTQRVAEQLSATRITTR